MRFVSKRLIAAALTLVILSGMMLAMPSRVQAGAVISVTTTSDEFTANGNCSLREAIVAANENRPVDRCPAGSATSMDTIVVPAGYYLLTIKGENEDNNRSGDLDILQSVTISGAGTSKTIIDATGLNDRVFQVINAQDVYFRELTISHGYARGDIVHGRGGGIFNTGSVVYVYGVILDNNAADNTGGSIDNDSGSFTTISRTTIRNSIATHGGAVYNLNWLLITASLLTNNQANESGGAIDNNTLDATLYLASSTLTRNYSVSASGTAGGAAIFNDGNVQITNATIVKNTGIGMVLSVSTSGFIANTIIAGNGVSNTVSNCDASVSNAKLEDRGHNLVDNTVETKDCQFLQSSGNGNIFTGNWTNVKIAEYVANNGGPTLTLALSPDSPAVDAGQIAGAPVYDQRMYIRPIDGNLDGSSITDIGAFEYRSVPRYLYMPFVSR